MASVAGQAGGAGLEEVGGFAGGAGLEQTGGFGGGAGLGPAGSGGNGGQGASADASAGGIARPACPAAEYDWLDQTLRPEPDLTSSRPWGTPTPQIAIADGRLLIAGQAAPDSAGLELSVIEGSSETYDSLPVPAGEIRDLVAGTDGVYVAAAECCDGAALTKYDLDGALSWTFVFGAAGSPLVSVSSIAVGDDGSVYAGGQFVEGASVGGVPVTTQGGLDFFVARLTDGTLDFVRTWGSTAADGEGPRVAPMPDGGVVAVGHLLLGLDFRRYTSSGDLVWTQTVPGPGSLFAVDTDRDGTITAGGVFRDGALDFRSLGGPLHCPRGEFTAFVVRLDENGRHVWSRAWASPIDGGASAIGLLVHEGWAIVTGHYGMHALNRETRSFGGYVRWFDAEGTGIGAIVLNTHPYPDLAVGDSGELFVAARAVARLGEYFVPQQLDIWKLRANIE